MRLRIMALTLAFALGVAGLVSAQESGNWFTSLFARRGAAEPAKSGAPTLTPSLSNQAVIQAQANLQRRREVCQKLMENAISLGDDDLLRMAEQLDLRIFEAYIAAVGRAPNRQAPIGEISMKDVRAAQKSAKGGR